LNLPAEELVLMDDKVKLKSNKVSKTTLVLGLLVVALLAVSIGLLVAYLNAKAANDKEEVRKFSQINKIKFI